MFSSFTSPDLICIFGPFILSIGNSSLQILVPPIRGVRRGSDEETEGKDENRHLNLLGILTSELLISSSVNEI